MKIFGGILLLFPSKELDVGGGGGASQGVAKSAAEHA